MSFELPDQFGWVLLCASLMAFSILLIGFFIPGRVRNNIFTEDYMKRHFGTQHQQTFQQQILKGGYPDNGNGQYSQFFTYKQWYQFNNAQRAHMNYLQWIASNLAFLIISGLYFPITAASIGAGIIVARILYSCGYSSKGPQGRFIGVSLNTLLTIAQITLSIISAVHFINQNQSSVQNL